LSIPSLCFITNYNLVIDKTNIVCEDNDIISNHQLDDFDIINMVPSLYTKASVKFHVETLRYVLVENPPFINKFVEKYTIIYRDIETLMVQAKEEQEKSRKMFKEYCDEMSGKNAEQSQSDTTQTTNTEASASANVTATEKTVNSAEKSKSQPTTQNGKTTATATGTTQNQEEISEEWQKSLEFNKQMEEGLKTLQEVKNKVINNI